MTNYMELLMQNQPWNLIVFMVLPMGLAEAIVASEFFSLYRNDERATSTKLNKVLSIILGVYFTGLMIYVAIKILPTMQWRGSVDIIAMSAYMACVLPLLILLALELGIIAKGATFRSKLKIHFCTLIVFLVLNHVAMALGMTDPGNGNIGGMQMNHMNGMSHSMDMSGPQTDHSSMDHGSMHDGSMSHNGINMKDVPMMDMNHTGH
ncbi:DUF6803 family protein, partial [uncultured Campylobacter sp.]|uniref:DUF6803 family protein n=1 Tax=uncultured Campylobacter sp. TaxID=218934 RepID=UPI002632F043